MYKFAIIEDDLPTNEIFKKYIENIWSDCDVEQFHSFDSALTAIKHKEFDLVVSDLDLGEGTDKLGGIKIAKVIDSMNCPLLIVSGSPHPEIHREIFKALGAWDYLQKPVVESDFAIQLKRAICFRKGQNSSHSNDVSIVQGQTLDANLFIDHKARQPVKWGGKPVHLSMTEVRLVEALVEHKNNALAFDALYPLLNTGRNLANLRVHIQNIRYAFKDIDQEFDRIKSKALIGYFWRDQ